VALELAGKNVVGIVPDGILWEVPFAALCDPAGKYLVETQAVFYAPSLTALLSMRELAEKRNGPPPVVPAPSGSILVMANPDFGPARKVQTALLGEFDEIPGTAQQAKAIAAIYGKAAVVYQGAEATEERVKRECGQFRLLHFATHGIYDPASPLYSGILLAKGGGEDGFWEAREIMEADLRAQLVVLSACQTGRGKIQSGEGIWGLAWALFVAGSPANLLTQWEVADASTADLMVSFYRHLQPGSRASPSTLNNQPSTVSKAESLRQAQLELLQDKRWSHPFYWAPFVLIGDWR
jgi:CHAT domain-containing protein